MAVPTKQMQSIRRSNGVVDKPVLHLFLKTGSDDSGDTTVTSDAGDSTVTPDYTDYSEAEAGSSPEANSGAVDISSFLAYHARMSRHEDMKMSRQEPQEFCRKRRAAKNVKTHENDKSEYIHDDAIIQSGFTKKTFTENARYGSGRQRPANLEIQTQIALHQEALSILKAGLFQTGADKVSSNIANIGHGQDLQRTYGNTGAKVAIDPCQLKQLNLAETLQRHAVRLVTDSKTQAVLSESAPRIQTPVQLNIHNALFRGEVLGRDRDLNSSADDAFTGLQPCIESIPLPQRLIEKSAHIANSSVPPSVQSAKKLEIVQAQFAGDKIEKTTEDSCNRPVKIDIAELAGQKIEWDPAFPCKLNVPTWR